MGEKNMAKGVTRRAFLKSTGAVVGSMGVLGALAGCAPQVNSKEEGESSDNLATTGSETLHFAGSCRGNCLSLIHISEPTRL